MKKKLHLLFILFVINATAQNRTGFYHKISSKDFPYLIHSYPDPEDPKKTIADTVHACQNLKGIVTLEKGVLNFDIWSFKDSVSVTQTSTCIDGAMDLKGGKLSIDINRKKLSDPTWVYKVPFRSRGFGVAALPLRLRFEKNSQPTNVSTQLSFAFNYNWMRGKTWFTHRSTTHYSWGVGPFFGFSTADIKKASSRDLTLYTADRNNPALTAGANIVFNRNNLGLVLASGVDISMGPDSGNWLYQGIPWLGLGLIANIGYF